MSVSRELLHSIYEETFNEGPSEYFVSPGRLEIIGNHTDHNNGLAIVAGASLRMYAAARSNKSNIIKLNSYGFGRFETNAKFKRPNSKMFGRTNALLSGIVSGFIKRGYKVGGLNIAMMSEVLSGSGISSSAAFEILLCQIINQMFNRNKVSKMEMVLIAQEAESLYFGKPCGLLDQIGACYGNISVIDFAKELPEVKSTSFPFDLHIYLTNPGGSHAGLTDYYASIPNDMIKVANTFNKKCLREVGEEEFNNYVNSPNCELSELEINRAIHYFEENKRVVKAFEAITNKDEKAFIQTINDSGLSSSLMLKNTYIPGMKEHSPEEALEIARSVAPKSAHRVHGGGFMGTIISFVKDNEVSAFKKALTDKYGPDAVIEVSIAPGSGLY